MPAKQAATLLDRLRDAALLEPAQFDELARLPEAADPEVKPPDPQPKPPDPPPDPGPPTRLSPDPAGLR